MLKYLRAALDYLEICEKFSYAMEIYGCRLDIKSITRYVFTQGILAICEDDYCLYYIKFKITSERRYTNNSRVLKCLGGFRLFCKLEQI